MPNKSRDRWIAKKMAKRGMVAVATAGPTPKTQYARLPPKPKKPGKKKRRRQRLQRTFPPLPTNAEEYREYLKSRHWTQRRKLAIEQAGGKCNRCGATSFLQVHHLSYERLYMERKKDLEVLCRGCHENEHEGQVEGVFDPMTKAFMAAVANF
jgi:hypothetical protein